MRVEFRMKAAHRFAPGVRVEYSDRVEVGLSCATCQRNGRTVGVGASGSVCLKNGHPFDGRLDSFEVEEREGLSVATYSVSYTFDPFVDVRMEEKAQTYPDWGRISFETECPCGARTKQSTQTNMVRPFRQRCGAPLNEGCGLVLYEETGVLPLFECWPLTGAS
jgi:hypothetical protein